MVTPRSGSSCLGGRFDFRERTRTFVHQNRRVAIQRNIEAPAREKDTQNISFCSGQGPVDSRTTGWLTRQTSLCVLLRTQKSKHFLLVNRLVVPGLTAFSKSLCVKSWCALFLQLRITSDKMSWQYHPGVNLYIYHSQDFLSCNDSFLYG